METNAQYFDCLCRTCMNQVETSSHDGNTKPQQQWLSIFDTSEECGEVRIAELLSDAVPQIVVHPSDVLPKKICTECLQRLLSVYQFQQMCVQSDKQLHELLSKEQIVLKTPVLEEAIKCETETNDADSQPLKDLRCSSTLQYLQQPSIQEVTVRTLGPETAQSSATEHLLDDNQLLEHCNDSQGAFEKFIKNEPIENDEADSEYSDGDTMHSIISVTKDEVLPIEFEDQQLNDATSRHNCHLCNKSYKRSEYLTRHLNNHKKKANDKKEYCFACNLCSKSYKKQPSLTRHLNLAHSKEPQFTCDFCNKREQHTTYAEDKPYECPHCPLRFNSKSNLGTHKKIHEEIKQHECDICGRKFQQNINLMRHKRTHSKEKHFKCDLCEKQFAEMGQLKAHIRTHTGEKPFKCKYCERAFASQSSLTHHLHSHLGRNIHRCKFCPLAFRLATEMRSHLTSHKNEDAEVRERNLKALHEVEVKLELKFSKENTKGQSREEQQQQKSYAEEIVQQSTGIIPDQHTTHSEDKPYECPHCPLRFNSKSNLETHRKIHEEIKRHECDICGRKFGLKNNLKMHKVRVHSKEKPHKCDQCEMRFATIGYLQIHIRKHTGEKPYKCKYCERGFATPTVLSKHSRKHFGNNVHRCKFCPLAFPSSTEMRLHLISHKNEDPEVRERNLKALQEQEAKLKLKFSKEISKGQSTEEQQQQKLSKKEIEQQLTDEQVFRIDVGK